jgi:hypothetical protein
MLAAGLRVPRLPPGVAAGVPRLPRGVMVTGRRSWKWGSAVTFGGAAPDERSIFRWEIEDIEARCGKSTNIFIRDRIH